MMPIQSSLLVRKAELSGAVRGEAEGQRTVKSGHCDVNGFLEKLEMED